MQLRTLRPKQGANLVQLRSLMEGRGWRSALPEALPDSTLLQLARDFRCVESSFTSESESEEEGPPLSAALYVVMNLLVQHPARGPADGVTLSETGMMRALQVYQRSLEREVLTRITGLATDARSSLLDGLLRCIDE